MTEPNHPKQPDLVGALDNLWKTVTSTTEDAYKKTLDAFDQTKKQIYVSAQTSQEVLIKNFELAKQNFNAAELSLQKFFVELKEKPVSETEAYQSTLQNLVKVREDARMKYEQSMKELQKYYEQTYSSAFQDYTNAAKFLNDTKEKALKLVEEQHTTEAVKKNIESARTYVQSLYENYQKRVEENRVIVKKFYDDAVLQAQRNYDGAKQRAEVALTTLNKYKESGNAAVVAKLQETSDFAQKTVQEAEKNLKLVKEQATAFEQKLFGPASSAPDAKKS